MNRLSTMFDLDPATAAKLQRVYGPYNPNPGSPDYQPNPGLVGQPIPEAPAAAPPPVLGRAAPGTAMRAAQEQGDSFGGTIAKAFSSPEPLVQNPFRPPPPAVVDGGEIDDVVDGGEIDAPSAGPAAAAPAMGGGGGPRGMWMPGPQSVSTQSTQYDPRLLDQYRQASDEQQHQAELRMMTEGAMNTQDTIALRAKMTAKAYADDVYKTKADELQARKNAYTNEQLTKLRQISTELQQKEDPQAFFKEKGTLATVGMAIAMGVGQYAAMMTRTENMAARIIDKAIDQNINAQRQNLQNKARQFDAESNLLALNTAAFGSEEAGLVATRLHYLDAAESMIDSKLLEERGPLQTKLDGYKLKEQLAVLRKQAAGQFLDLTKVGVTTQESQHYGMVGGAGASTKPLENTATLSDGTTVQFQNSEQGNKAVERFQAHAKVQTLYSMAKEKRAALQKMSPGTPEYEAERNALQKMATDIIYEESMARGQGVVKKEEMEEGLKTSPIMRGVGGAGYIRGYLSKLDPTIDRDFKAGAQGIDSAIKQSEEEQRAIAKAAGARLIQRGYATDAAGRPTPTGQYTGQDLQPDQRLAPSGFKPLDSRVRMPTAGKPLSQTTPQAKRIPK